jgi:hypothetical protein
MIDKKQLGTVEYFSQLAMITNDARCTQEIKFGIDMAKAAFNKKKTVHQQIGLKRKEESSKLLHGAETWTFQEVDQIYLESIAM